MPWQQYVADVVLEIDPDTGRLVYDEFGLTVPRQSGKSTLVLAKATHRCSATKFFGGRQRLVYTAQTRAKAREKWEEDFTAELEASSAFRSRVVAHKGNGNEHLRFTNGSRFGIDANTEKAGHGGTLDEAYIDEAFAQVDFRLEQAFGPAMITRANKQLAWISTAGWLDGSPYLEQKIRVGRAAVESGATRLAYFEWSSDDDADPGDPATWRACMPALGFTISEDAIRAEYLKALAADKLNEFKRAYLNLWVPKVAEFAADPTAVDAEAWAELEDAGARFRTVEALAVDVAPDLSWSSVGAAGVTENGTAMVELVKRDRGTFWVSTEVVAVARRHGIKTVAVDGKGQAKEFIEPLQHAGLHVVVASTDDITTACASMAKGVDGRLVVHGPQPELDAAIVASRRRSFGDGLFAFSRRASAGDISPLYAVTLAAWASGLEPPTSAYESHSLMTV